MDSTIASIKRFLLGGGIELKFSLVNFGLRLLGAVLVLVVGIALIRLIISLLSGTLRRTVSDPTIRRYAISASRILLWAILVIIILSVFGIETTSLLTVLATAGLAIGLALQGSLSNIAAGFMLLMFRPFKAGDQVEVAGVTGTVIELGIFSTIIDLPDNVRAFVPNSSIFSGVIRNRSINEYLRVEMKVTVESNTDITRTQQVIQRLLATNELVMEIPRPEVQVVEDDSPGVTIAVRPYTKLKNADAVRTIITKQLREELRNAGIEVVRQ